MTADDLLDELYGSDPADFVATRDRLVHALKAAGDKDRAAALARRRRPTAAAAELNRLSRVHRAELAGLLQLGDRIRDTQISAVTDRAAREQLRTLERERRERTDALLAAAQSNRDEVERGLAAALADPEIAARLRAGHLERPPEGADAFGLLSASLGDVPAPSARPEKPRRRSGRDSAPARAAETAGGDADRSRRAQERTEALAAEQQARIELEHATRALRDAQAAVRRAEERVAGAERTVARASQRAEETRADQA